MLTMGLKILTPRFSRIIPYEEERSRMNSVIESSDPEKFETYADWFFFIHIDPVSRFIHLVGMLTGIYLFINCVQLLISGEYFYSIALLPVGIFFFYQFGVIGHLIFDKGSVKSDPKYWSVTLPAVIYINLLTLTGTYGLALRKHAEKYPFVIDEWQLVERSFLENILYLFGFKKEEVR